MSRSPVWYFNTRGMYEGFPHRSHEALFKAYYLLQAACWIQQVLVLMLQLEKPRKDIKEFALHHLITISLIGLSYSFHFTYMGLAVYITHDISDFFLATSKCLNYIDSPITTVYYAFFMFVWGYSRHYLNIRLLYSVLTDFSTVGPFELNWETQQYKCWISQIITFFLLAALQSVNIFWFALILKIAKRIVWDKVVEDVRSDYGDEDEGDKETTEDKRMRMGVSTGVDTNGVNGKVEKREMPKVLLNGVLVEDTLPSAPVSNGTRK